MTRGSFAPWPISSGFLILLDERQRRALVEELLALLGRVVADAVLEHLHHRRPVRRDRLEQRDEVRRADDVDAAGEHVGRERQADERGVAAVAAAHDGDLVRVGDLLLDGPVDGVDQVVVHLAGPLLVAGVEELLAEAGRAAEVDAQHGVAAVGAATGASG